MDAVAAALLRGAARVARSASDATGALQAVLDLVCGCTGWPLGHAFSYDAQRKALTSGRVWHSDDPERFATFVQASEAVCLAPGEGLPGRVAATGSPAWISDIATDPNFPRAPAAARCGIRTALGFPVVSTRGTESVLEFFTTEAVEPAAVLLEAIAHVGMQLGATWDRLRAEESLAASERRVQSLVELAPDAMVVVNASGTIVLVNEQTETLTGYRRDELIGLPVDALVPDDLRFLHASERGRYLQAPRRRPMGAGRDLYLRRRDGTRLPVDVSLSPIDSEGQHTVVAAVRDVSERSLADLAIRTSEARLSEAQRIAGVGSWTWSVGSDEVACSPQLYRIYGMDPSAGPATFSDFLRRVHPADRDAVAAAFQRTVATLEPSELEYRVVPAEGQLRWVHARGEAVARAGGRASVLAGYCQDVTRRKEEEAGRQRAQEALAVQQSFLERIARGLPLASTLDAICREMEARLPGSCASVLLVDPERKVLRHAAAPSLPEAFLAAIDGMPVAEGVAACGTAAARGTTVVVEDTLTSPLTNAFLELAVRHHLRSVWSHPIVGSRGAVLGTFALYRDQPHVPDREEVRAVEGAGYLAGLAIERSRGRRRWRRPPARIRSPGCPTGPCSWSASPQPWTGRPAA